MLFRSMARLRPFAGALSSGTAIRVMAATAIVVGLVLIAFVVHQPEKAWYFQPWFQVCVSVGIALALARHAMKRHGRTSPGSFRDRFLQVPD